MEKWVTLIGSNETVKENALIALPYVQHPYTERGASRRACVAKGEHVLDNFKVTYTYLLYFGLPLDTKRDDQSERFINLT